MKTISFYLFVILGGFVLLLLSLFGVRPSAAQQTPNLALAKKNGMSIAATPDEFSVDNTLLRIESDQLTDVLIGAGIITRVSINSNGSEGNNQSGFFNSGYEKVPVTPDGRFIAFSSKADNLVDNDENNMVDIFVHDRMTGETELVSVSSTEEQYNVDSRFPSISNNGRYVAFIRYGGETNVLVRDRKEGNTERVDVSDEGEPGNSTSSSTAISGDGRYVAFHSLAWNLVDNDINNANDVFVHDMMTGETELVSVSTDGIKGNGHSSAPAISSDGRYVAFVSVANTLVLGDNNNSNDIFVHDRLEDTTKRISLAQDGSEANDDSGSPSISSDGRFVAFNSYANNLIDADDTNDTRDIFVYDRQTRIRRVSIASDGEQSNNQSGWLSISPDGRYVAFSSSASNLVDNDTNNYCGPSSHENCQDVFVHDTQVGQTIRITIGINGEEANSLSLLPSISSNGRFVSFVSWASNLVPGDTNKTYDVFVRSPFLDLPVSYLNFEEATKANTGQPDSEALINSWFDHTDPGWGNNDDNLTRWDGTLGTLPVGRLNCRDKPHNPSDYSNCYASHDGIDIRTIKGDYNVLAAATGRVIFEVHDYPSNDCGGFGNCVKIDHQNCFMTLYGHLSSVDLQIVGATSQNPIPVLDRQQIGIMGNTGSGSQGTHLHFGVYMDPNCDGDWTDKVPVDPYGWSGSEIDPYTYTLSAPLWKHSINPQIPVGSSGGSVSSPSGNYQVDIPFNAVNETITIDLLLASPIAEPSAQLRSVGRSFWFRVLEWLSDGTSYIQASNSTNQFNIPISVTINYTDTILTHLNENNLSIMRWNDNSNNWEELSTIVDSQKNIAIAQTIEMGYFDLQAPLHCPMDVDEPNDDYYSSSWISVNETISTQIFDITQDEDWFQFEAHGNWYYGIETENLASDVDTIIEIYDVNGITILISDNDSGDGLASKLVWKAPNNGTYFIRVKQNAGSAFGCSASYDISVKNEPPIFLPLIFSRTQIIDSLR